MLYFILNARAQKKYFATKEDIPAITVNGASAKTLKISVDTDGYLCIDTE